MITNTVDISGQLNIHATTNHILKAQQVDGSIVYDSLESSFKTVDKASILKTNNVDILSYLNLKLVASNVYTTQELDRHDVQ